MKHGNQGVSSTSTSNLLRVADSDQKISEVSGDEIVQTLGKVFILLGFNSSDMLDTYEIPVLVDFIKETYSVRYSLKDIETAFKLAMRGDFEVDLKLYGKRFSSLYLSNVMNAYQTYKTALKQANMLKSVPLGRSFQLPEANPYLLTEEQEMERYTIFLNFVKEHGVLPLAYDVDCCYNVLKRLVGVPSVYVEFDAKESNLKKKAVIALESSVENMVGSYPSSQIRAERERIKKDAVIIYEMKKIVVKEEWFPFLKKK